MKRLSVWMAVLALASAPGCAHNPEQPGLNGDQERGTPDAGANANEGNNTGIDTSDGAMPSAVPDAGPPPLPMPKADDPCGTDLTFVGGKVAPKVGVTVAQASGADPSKAGKYKVLEQALKIPIEATMRSAAGYEITVEAGEIEGTFYAPSEDGTTIAKGKRFPMIVGGAGFGAKYPDYKNYWTQFASHGIAVLGIATRGSNTEALHDKEALETSLAITWLIDKSPLKDSIDPEKLGTVGHSKGGKVAFFAAAIDSRIDIVFGWDPSNAGGPPCFVAGIINAKCQGVPVAPNCAAVDSEPMPEGIMQYMHAESFVFGVPPDALNLAEEHNSLNFYRGAPSPADLVYFEGGHAAWVEGGVAGLLGDADIARITRTVQTAKLLTFFYGATDLGDYLPGGSYLKNEKKVTMVETK